MASGQPPAGMTELQEILNVIPNVILEAPRIVPRPIGQLPKMTDLNIFTNHRSLTIKLFYSFRLPYKTSLLSAVRFFLGLQGMYALIC